MKMELEKRDIRFKELEKEVKKRIASSTGTADNSSINLTNSNIVSLSAEMNEIDKEELEELRQ